MTTKNDPSQAEASDSPASRSMGWVEAQKLADEALRLTEGTSPEPWAFNGYSKLTANLDFDAWSALDDQVGFRPDASEDASAYAAWRDRNKAAYDADPDVAYVPAEYGDTATGRHAKDAVFMEHARTQWPALARLVKSLPPPPGQEAPATSPQDSRFANPKSEISPMAFVPHGETPLPTGDLRLLLQAIAKNPPPTMLVNTLSLENLIREVLHRREQQPAPSLIPNGEPCRLADCPPGLFVHEDTLAIKAWYGGCGWVFVDESGTELFGGTDTVEQKLQLTVQPVKLSAASSVEAPMHCGVEMEREDHRWHCGKCGYVAPRVRDAEDEPDQLIAERDRARMDAALLLAGLRDVHVAIAAHKSPHDPDCDCLAKALRRTNKLINQPHHGAALLADLEAMRKKLRALTAENERLRASAPEARRD